uniref:Uncharacterized protein n=1 Tax=Pseudenhygromyxa salsuginis TaxID=442868 RepID=A0A3S7UVG0_9BACT|nr:hypothetical protein [Pseudenhygromyxa salsuginis]
MFLELTLLIAAGVGNLAWDLTGRRFTARSRRRERRSRRREALPLPTADEQAADPFAGVSAIAPEDFVAHTRVVLEELDRVVDHFDLILLRAEAGESLVGDVVFVGADAPRLRSRELLEGWLGAVASLPAELRERLRDLGLPDATLRTMLEQEQERCQWPNAGTATGLLGDTANDLERAVVLLSAFLRTLATMPANPYR